jgi:hypothetical protein
MSEITKEKPPEKPAGEAVSVTPESQEGEQQEPHHHHVHHDHLISPPSTGRSYLNPGAITIRR